MSLPPIALAVSEARRMEPVPVDRLPGRPLPSIARMEAVARRADAIRCPKVRSVALATFAELSLLPGDGSRTKARRTMHVQSPILPDPSPRPTRNAGTCGVLVLAGIGAVLIAALSIAATLAETAHRNDAPEPVPFHATPAVQEIDPEQLTLPEPEEDGRVV